LLRRAAAAAVTLEASDSSFAFIITSYRLPSVAMKAIEGIPRMALLGFFSSHIVATILIDVQAIAPKDWVPSLLGDFLHWYATSLNDPLMSKPRELPWFQSLICLEMAFQLPFFVWAVSVLSSDRKGTHLQSGCHRISRER
jgi:hypothetical protein